VSGASPSAGGDSAKAATDYLRLQFESRNRNKDKRIYTHITYAVAAICSCFTPCLSYHRCPSVLHCRCATDTNNVQAVFNAVKVQPCFLFAFWLARLLAGLTSDVLFSSLLLLRTSSSRRAWLPPASCKQAGGGFHVLLTF
jgi:hypothetical protein